MSISSVVSLAVERAKARLRLVRHRHSRILAGSGRIRAHHRNASGLKIACVEEVAYHMGYIERARLLQLARRLGKASTPDTSKGCRSTNKDRQAAH